METKIASSSSSGLSKVGNKKKQSLSGVGVGGGGISTQTEGDAILPVEQYLGTPEAQYKLLSQLILPCLQQGLERNPMELVALGNPPRPDETNGEIC